MQGLQGLARVLLDTEASAQLRGAVMGVFACRSFRCHTIRNNLCPTADRFTK